MAGVVLLSRSIRPCESKHVNTRTFSEQVIARILYDSRCGMSDVAFCTAPPFGGPSCIIISQCDFITMKKAASQSAYTQTEYRLPMAQFKHH